MGLQSFLRRLFSHEEYGIPSTTLHGEQVRSRAEKRIADYFTKNGVRYEYERELQRGIWIFKNTYARPDFYLPDFDVYVEYWGLADVDWNYQRQMKWKMSQYRRNGIRFISIYPRNMDNLDWVFRRKFRDATGFELPVRLS